MAQPASMKPYRLTARSFSLVACLLCAAILAASGCGPQTGEGPGHRAQPLGLTPEQEYELGVKAYREVLNKAHVVHDGPDVKRIREIGGRIARAAEIEPLQREINLHLQGYRFDWEFNLLQSNQVNAFCLPGGKVAVFTGLLGVAENDDELATVMSHEIAHALAHHASERLARAQMYEHAVNALNGSLGSLDPEQRERLIGLLGAGASIRSLAYDRKQESEADHIGIFLMTFAGYNPDEALRFWQRMEELSARRGRPPEILSDHPSDERRIAQIRQWIPQAKAGKRAFDQGNIAR
jgi:predicted Zn-dependent protease